MLELMTFQPNGSNRRINRAWQMPRNYDEMVQRRKALQAWAALSCGFFGRSPDHLASALVGQVMGIDVFRKHSVDRAKALADYFEFASENDFFLTYVIINPQAQRGKDWGEQDDDLVARIVNEDSTGVTIRGAKMLGTSSIMANEVFVANLQPLKAGEEDLAFSCALPMNAKGLRVLSRKSYEAHAVSVYDNPISSRFDENDALMYFDDVKVPWERMFVYRDPDMCRAQFHDTPGHAYQNYQAQIRLSVKIAFLAGIARARHRSNRHHQYAAGCRAARHARRPGRHGQRDAVRHGGIGLATRRMVRAEQAFHVFGASPHAGPLSAGRADHSRSRRRRADHAALLHRGLRQPRIGGDHRQDPTLGLDEPGAKSEVSESGVGRDRSEFGSRHTQYEMFYAGARFVTCGHSFRTFDWKNAAGLVESLLSSYDLQSELSTPSIDAGRRVKIAIVNLGQIVSGDWRNPFVAGDTIVTDGDRCKRGSARQRTSRMPTW